MHIQTYVMWRKFLMNEPFDPNFEDRCQSHFFVETFLMSYIIVTFIFNNILERAVCWNDLS